MSGPDLHLVQPPVPAPPPARRRPRLPAKQLGGVESPATVLLIPVNLGDEAVWWSHDGVLLGGIQINRLTEIEGVHNSRVAYLPRPIPRSWGESEFGVCVEYEADDHAVFRLKVYYGCGDPSELRLGQTKMLAGETGSKQRLRFKLLPKFLAANELFRCTLEIARTSPGCVLIYGAWMEIGV